MAGWFRGIGETIGRLFGGGEADGDDDARPSAGAPVAPRPAHGPRDPVTGLLDHDGFAGAMGARAAPGGAERRRARVEQDALLRLDIDLEPGVEAGAPTPDAVLAEVSRRLNRLMREDDLVARWGGERFVVYIRNAPLEALPALVGRVLGGIESRPVEAGDASLRLSASVGLVPLPLRPLPEAAFGWEQALAAADQALALSKERGSHRAHVLLAADLREPEAVGLLVHDLGEAARRRWVELREVLGPAARQAG
jgi:diguanylate cyclase (GGDEF)-like protein